MKSDHRRYSQRYTASNRDMTPEEFKAVAKKLFHLGSLLQCTHVSIPEPQDWAGYRKVVGVFVVEPLRFRVELTPHPGLMLSIVLDDSQAAMAALAPVEAHSLRFAASCDMLHRREHQVASYLRQSMVKPLLKVWPTIESSSVQRREVDAKMADFLRSMPTPGQDYVEGEGSCILAIVGADPTDGFPGPGIDFGLAFNMQITGASPGLTRRIVELVATYKSELPPVNRATMFDEGVD